MTKNKEINYDVRVAKTIERKMLSETISRLWVLGGPKSYRYIGMGSYYFADFRLFHKVLGLDDMISIEWDVDNQSRFNFNNPFHCIRMEFGNSWDISLPWDKKTILWLDYDKQLDANKLLDVKQFCVNALPGSLIVITVAAETDGLEEGGSSERLDKIKKRIHPTVIPNSVLEKDLPGWGTAVLYRQLIDDYINYEINTRNGVLPVENKLNYKQFFNFHYSDGGKMLTVGGLIYNEAQKHFVETVVFDNLNFLRHEAEPYVIEVPVLTYKELRYLDSKLPSDPENLDSLLTDGIPTKDIVKYRNLYRYFPTFSEVSI
jgi:hypothetical protein